MMAKTSLGITRRVELRELRVRRAVSSKGKNKNAAVDDVVYFLQY